MAHRVTLIPGDGTGPELTEATRRVLEATGVDFDWDVQQAGADVMDEHGGNPLPEHVARLDPRERRRAQGADHDARSAAASAPSTSRCARALDLYAQVRPCKSYPGVRSRFEDVDLSSSARTPRTSTPGSSTSRARADARGADRLARVARAASSAHATPGISIKPISVTGTRRIVRVRVRLRAPERPPQGHGRAQGEHHEVHGRPLPARRARGRGGEPRHRVRRPHRRQHVHAARPAARGVRRARAAEPLRRHRLRPRAPG